MNIRKKIEKIADVICDWLVIPFILIATTVYLDKVYNSKFTNMLSLITCGFGSLICIFVCITKIIKVIANDKKVIFPIVMSIGFIISSIIIALSSDEKLSNLLFYIGIGCLELHIIYDIIYTIFLDKKKKTSVPKIIIFAVLFITIGFLIIYFSTYNLDDKTLFNSLIDVFSAIIGGGITLTGVAWTIFSTEKNRKKDREFELIKNCQIITFDKIENFEMPKGSIAISNESNYLVLYNINSDDQNNKSIKSSSKYCFLRFNFNTASFNNIKNITFSRISIYPKFDGQKQIGSKPYIFEENASTKDKANISSLKNGTIQVNCYLVLDIDKEINNNSIIKKELLNDLQKENNKVVFFNINYSVTNINNVSYSAELKFFCRTQVVDSTKCVVDKIENVSNWIETPKLLNCKEKSDD